MSARLRFPFIITLASLALFINHNDTIGQSLEKIKFSRFDVNAGLSNSNVTCFLHDSQGFLWIGTPDGLNKFDGTNFKIYRQIAGDTTGFYNNSINSIFEDHQGVLWVSTSNRGFYHYDRNLDRFIAVKELSVSGEISSISEDDNGNLWITGVWKQHGYVGMLNRETNQWEHHFAIPRNISVKGIIQESENEYWLLAWETGLYKWNRKTGTIQLATDEHSGLHNSIHKGIKDKSGNLWFATRNGLSKFDRKTNRFIHFRHDTQSPKKSLPINVVRDICLDGNYLWIGTENGGLCLMNTQTNDITIFSSDSKYPFSISDNSIWSVYKDHQNRIWIGTYSKGICVYDKMKFKFSELDVPFENDIVNAIAKDHKNRLWIGTEGGLVVKDGAQIKQYKNDPSKKGSLSNNPVLSIFEDSKQRMWFGTWDGGADQFDERTNQFIHYNKKTPQSSGLANPNVYCVLEDIQTHHILVSTYHGLHELVDEGAGTFKKYIDEIRPANNFGRTIFQDTKGNVWFGTITALNQFNLKTGDKNIYFFDEKSGSGIMVNTIAEDASGQIWVGTSAGLFKIVNSKVVESYTTEHGLPNNIVNGILVDQHNLLWISTTHGISKFDPTAKTFTNFDIDDGLLSDEFKPGAYFKSDNGQMFFGGKGVNVFYPDSIRINPHIPTVLINGLKIFSRSIQIGAADSILRQAVSESKEITLKPEFNSFTLEYVALNLTASNKNQFAYMLEKFDKNWNMVGTQRFATFTNLDPGTYIFHVKGSNNDGVWNEQGASITIHILPNWWQTWWFKSMLAGALFLIAITISTIRTRNIRKLNSTLEFLVNQKTSELQEANSELRLHEEEIQKQNVKLQHQHEELAAQNEELTQGQEEISSQRDQLANQNKKLEEAQKIIEQQNSKIKERNVNLEEEVAKRTKELIEYNHQLEQFAFIAAHNLRAPVARILGLGQLLPITQTEERELIIKKLITTTKEMDDAVKDLNTILELKNDRNAFISKVNLIDEMAILLRNLEREIKVTEAEISIDFSRVNIIHTIKPYLDSILYNLLSNAIKYRDPIRKPIIQIASNKEADFIIISIKDNGLGIDIDQFRDKIFTLYKRFHTHVEGKGMGLYLIKTQVESMGGKIEVESEVNKGTTFKVYLKIKE